MPGVRGDLHRVAVISDVHGNVTALEAVLADIERRGIEHVVNLGDVVGKGPRGAESIRLTQERCTVTVRGNWDAFIARDAVQSWEHAQWVRDRLTPSELSWLGALPNVHELVLSGQRIRLFHASPVSEFTRVFAPAEEAEFRAFVAQTEFTGDGPVPSIVGYGDIHGTYLAIDYGITVFNAGSVGNALDAPGAPYVILEGLRGDPEDAEDPEDPEDPEASDPGHVTIGFVRVPYDVEAEIAAAAALGMPGVEAYALELREQQYRGSSLPVA